MTKKSHPKLARKGQDAGNAATLVAVIALLIIFYLLFIPPSFRDQILEGNSTGSSSSSSSSIVNETILKANPGTLTPLSAEEIEHNIPAIMLYSTKNSKVLGIQNSIDVKATIFGSKQGIMKFDIEDIENTDDILLTFADANRKGSLIIRLNGNEIYNGEVKQENPEPLRLNKNFMVRGTNTIEFDIERPGIRFWRIHRHELSTVQITGNVKDITQQKSRNIFIVTGTEKSNVKRALLRFTPQCVLGKVGRLNVLVNQHSIYYSVPDCGGRVVIEFTPDVLLEGENTIIFDSEEGNYLVELISITSELKDVIQPTYYFDVPTSIMDSVRDGTSNVLLQMKFLDTREMKSGTININGRETNIYQREKTYSKNINDYLVDGSNAIKIKPDSTLEIVSLEVVQE